MEPGDPPNPDPDTLDAVHRTRLPAHQLWFVVAGLVAPYVAKVLGWWVAERLAGGRHDYGYWDAAENWVYRGIAVAIVLAGWAFLKLMRRIKRSDQQAVVAVSELSKPLNRVRIPDPSASPSLGASGSAARGPAFVVALSSASPPRAD
jgi:hypothetical protein